MIPFEVYRNQVEYIPGLSTESHDLAIAGWWCRMLADGDLSGMFTPRDRELPKFIALMQDPTLLTFQRNPEGEILAAVWTMPATEWVGFCGVWIRKDYRRRRQTANMIFHMYEYHFRAQQYKALLGVSKRFEIIPEHLKLGYRFLCRVPYLYGDADGYMVVLERERFDQVHTRWREKYLKAVMRLGVT